jgi:DNA-binding NarL/FixJ family response regulator
LIQDSAVPQFRILSVGQCGYDDSRIRRYLGQPLDAEVVAADTHDEAWQALSTEAFDLVMVNRVGDTDGAPGIELIRKLKSDASTLSLPVMLVSNFPSAQGEAANLGATPGFGKDDLGTSRAVDAIRHALARPVV